jgi:hypothetical protein
MKRLFERRNAPGQRPVHTARQYLVAGAVSLICALPAVGLAKSNLIVVLSKNYTATATTNKTNLGTPVTQTASKASSKPLDVALADGDLYGEGTAGAFYVSAATGGHSGNAYASATSSVTFAALAGPRSPLSFDWLDLGLPFYSFSADIVDLTAHKDIFSIGYTLFQGPLPIRYSTGSIAITPLLIPFHLYEVTMDVSSNSAYDSESLRLSIDGLNPLTFGRAGPLSKTFAGSDAPLVAVPEPGSSSLILAAACLFLVRRAARRR